jgi:WD40 repeat protein
MPEEQHTGIPGARAVDVTVDGDNRLFISYSRRDAPIVRALYDGLSERGIGVWVDWEDIPPSAEWWTTIRRAIDGADAFAFVISPDSIASPVCGDELAHAIAAGKRLIPLLHRHASDGQQVPDSLARLNWIFARNDDSLPAALDRFVEALTTDLELLRTHARLLVRAREWEASGRDASSLLRGGDLDTALQWLSAVSVSGPMPTELHRDYLVSSQQAQREQSERWRRLYEEALARDLASRSQLLVDQRGTALPLAALLAVEAARRSPSLQTDLALRKVLRLMPLRHAVTPINGEHHTLAPAAERLATVNASRLDVWALDSRECIRTIDAGGELRTAGLSLMPFALSADGALVAAVVGDFEVRVWQIADGSVRLEHHCDTQVRGVSFSHEADRLMVTLDRPASLILHVGGGQAPIALEHESVMQNAAWRPGGAEIVLWGEESAEVWDPVQLRRTSTIPLGFGGGPTTYVCYSPRGEYLALLRRSTYEVNVFHVDTRTLVFRETRHVDLAFHPEDKAFAIASPEWSVAVYDLPSAQRRFRMKHDNSVWRVGFSRDGKRLWSKSTDGTTRVWELERDGAEVARYVDGPHSPAAVLFSRDGWRLHRVFGDRIETGDARGFVEWRRYEPDSPVFDVDADPGRPHVVLGTRNGAWFALDYSDLSRVKVLDGEQGRNAMGEQLTTTRFITPERVLLKRAFGGARVRNLSSANDESSLPDAQDSAMATSRNGRLCRLAGAQLTVWNAETDNTETRAVPDGTIALAVSGDGSMVALVGPKEVRLEPVTKKRGRKRRVPLEGERSIALDESGRRLALWRADDAGSAVRMVDVSTGRTLSRWELPARLHDLRFDATGDHVVLAVKDGTVQVWRSDAGLPLASFQHPAEAMCACFIKDAGLVVSGGWDGTARIWPWLPELLIRTACGRLDRDLTEAEWAQYLPGQAYRATRTLT